MKLKESVENNPFIYLLGTAVTVGILVVGVQEYFCRERVEIANQRSNLEISTLQSELLSIRRGLGENKYLDIRTFLYPKTGTPLSSINQKAKYTADDGFYAILDLPDWDYEAMNAEQFNKKMFGVELGPRWKKLFGDSRMHVWRAKTLTNVTAAGDYREAGPFITFEKTPISTVMGMAKEYLPEMAKEVTGWTMTTQEAQAAKKVLPALEKMFRGDAAQLELTTLIRVHYEELFDSAADVSTEIVQLQKIGNVLYIQFLTTVHNANVDGKLTSVFFVREEAMFVSDEENLTKIHIVVPSSDPSPRGPVYTRIQEWFSGLAIPVGNVVPTR